MQYIPPYITIKLRWQVNKGIGNEAEDFSRSTVALFLFNDENRWAVPCTADYTGLVQAELPATLAEGVYSLELVWYKNENSLGSTRCVQRTRKTCVFVIDNEATMPAEARAVLPDLPPPIPIATPTVRMTTIAAPYGYDGLSAYEICVLRGKTTKSEEEWAEALCQ